MNAKSLTVEDAQAANLVLVGPEKGRQAVHDLVTAGAHPALRHGRD